MVYGNDKDVRIPTRKGKTNQKDDRIVVAKDKVDRFKRAPQIKAEMYLDRLWCLRLRESGLHACRPQKNPKLTSRRKKKRIDFAKAKRMGR